MGPHLTQCGQGRGLPAHQVSSWTIKPFGHNTDRTGLTDRQWSDSIGQTVLQTVAQKLSCSRGQSLLFLMTFKQSSNINWMLFICTLCRCEFCGG